MAKRTPLKKRFAVGYGKPPKATQFQTGRSGNPRGRPKGTANFATVLEHALKDKVIVNDNGERRTISKLEALVTQMVNKAISGDGRARQQTLGVLHILEEGNAAQDKPTDALDDAEEQVMSTILASLRQTLKEPDDET
jgi:uncharacterized protein DUF5681